VVDLAVAIVVGSSFTALVNALVSTLWALLAMCMPLSVTPASPLRISQYLSWLPNEAALQPPLPQVADFITPLIAIIFNPGEVFGDLSFTINGSTFKYGHFINVREEGHAVR